MTPVPLHTIITISCCYPDDGDTMSVITLSEELSGYSGESRWARNDAAEVMDRCLPSKPQRKASLTLISPEQDDDCPECVPVIRSSEYHSPTPRQSHSIKTLARMDRCRFTDKTKGSRTASSLRNTIMAGSLSPPSRLPLRRKSFVGRVARECFRRRQSL